VTGYNIKCVTCHTYTVDMNNQITANGKTSTHANGVKDIAFASSLGSFNTTNATCSVKCHSDGVSSTPAPLRTPIWTELAQNKGPAYCGSCHAAAPATKLHTVHLTGAKGPLIGTAATVCIACHSITDGASTHADGIIQFTSGSCTACHPTVAPIWAAGQQVSCESCHVNNVSTVTNSYGTYSTTNLQKNVFTQSRHGQVAGANTCTLVCHSTTAAHIGAAQNGEKRLQAFAGVQQCDQCHTTASSSIYKALSSARLDLPSHGGLEAGFNVFPHYTSTVSNNLSKSCAACHDPHSTSKYMIRATINGIQVKPLTNMSTGFIDTDLSDGVYNGLCQVCHTKTSHFRKNSYMGGHNGDKWCLSCHKHKGTLLPGTFAFQPSGGCDACHGYPPVQSMTVAGIGQLGFFNRYSGAKLQNYSGGGGAHSVEGHISKTVKLADGNNACTNCHFNNAHNEGNGSVKPSKVNVQVDPQFKFNKDLPITYDGVQSDNRTLFKVGSCSNVSCHFQVTPKWSTQKN
jgi:predicted CxxxxCH...CXXCH cytochrome family protein